jgi:transposase
MKKLYVGVDVHLKQHIVSIVPITMFQDNKTVWKKTKSITIGNNRHDFEYLDLLLKSQDISAEQVSIAVDHTGGHYSEPISYFLKSKGYEVYYLGSASVKAAKEKLLGEENKTDKIDSATLAYLLYLRDFYKVSFHISAMSVNFESQSSLLRLILLQSRYYSKLGTQTTNRLRQYVHAVFPEGEERYFNKLIKILPHHPTPAEIISDPDAFNKSRIPLNSRKILRELAKKTVGVPGETYKYIIQDLALLRVSNEEKMVAIDDTIRALVIKHPYASILMSFPGVKEKSAAIIISTVKDINNWPTKNKFKKGLGVYGTIRETGEKHVNFRRGLSGDRMCRQGLYMVCFTAIRLKSNNDFHDFYERQVRKGKPRRKALVATMGKLAEIMYHCLKFNEPYKYQSLYHVKPKGED